MTASQAHDYVLSIYGSRFDGHIVVWRKRVRESTYHGQDDLNELSALIQRIAAQDDVYLALGLQKTKLNKRGTAETVVALPGFIADIDFASTKSSAKRYPIDQKEALQILASFALPPTWVVHTGNGLHVHWLLRELLPTTSKKELARAKRIWAAFQRTLIAHFQKHERQIDSVGDLVRNFRIPGTLNHKSDPPKPVELIEHHPERRYQIGEVEELVIPFLDPVRTSKKYKSQEIDGGMWFDSFEAVYESWEWPSRECDADPAFCRACGFSINANDILRSENKHLLEMQRALISEILQLSHVISRER